MGDHHLKQRLANSEAVIGAGIYSNSPEVLEYAAVGMDWIWWEQQHTHPDWQTTIHALRTAQAMNIPVLIRSWTMDGDTIEHLLDTGAEGIIVPMVNTPLQASDIVRRCYYPPLGDRSFGSVRTERIEEDIHEWNKRIVVILMLETSEAVASAEAIAAVEGVDGLIVGTRDLSLRRQSRVSNAVESYGHVQSDLDQVLHACRKSSKAAGIIVDDEESLSTCVESGYRLICAGMDLDHIALRYDQMREAFRQAVERV